MSGAQFSEDPGEISQEFQSFCDRTIGKTRVISRVSTRGRQGLDLAAVGQAFRGVVFAFLEEVMVIRRAWIKRTAGSLILATGLWGCPENEANRRPATVDPTPVI